jgi:hypothetical protein
VVQRLLEFAIFKFEFGKAGVGRLDTIRELLGLWRGHAFTPIRTASGTGGKYNSLVISGNDTLGWVC